MIQQCMLNVNTMHQWSWDLLSMDAAGDGELVHSLVSIGKQTALHTVNVCITVIIIKSQQSCLMGDCIKLRQVHP